MKTLKTHRKNFTPSRLRWSSLAVGGALGLFLVLSVSTTRSYAGVEQYPKDVQKILKEKPCLTCHQIGRTGVGKLGPNLRRVGNRRSKAWIKRWLKNPPAMKPGTSMPANLLTAPEIEVMANFLVKQRNYFNKKKIVSRYKGAAAGKRLFIQYDCRSCHKVSGKYGTLINTAPDLHNVKTRHPTAWLTKWLRNPQSLKRGTFMPNFHLSTAEISALVAYLQTL